MASAARGEEVEVEGAGGGKKGDGEGEGVKGQPVPEQGLNCPRCDSPNTKFCYYNNYSLAQPRYFCKTCRRYWTKGGALRNVPVGGGCRKAKKSKPSSSSNSRLSSSSSDAAAAVAAATAADIHGELRFFHHHHQLQAFSRLHQYPMPAVFNTEAAGPSNNPLISFGDLSCPTEPPSTAAAPLIGFTYPLQASVLTPSFSDMGLGCGGDPTTSGMTSQLLHHHPLAATIESLSSINQGLHWKLQQQRLAMLFGADTSSSSSSTAIPPPTDKGSSCDVFPAALLDAPNRPATSKDIPVATAAGVSSRKVSAVGEANSSNSAAAEWFLDNSTAYTNQNAHTSTPANGTGNNWNAGIHTWGDMHQFSALP